jgi:ABC transporter substrate binding protein (PQQ-dependent alcohol dehydrogenase system)
LAEADDILLVNAGVPDIAWRDAGCHPHLVHVTASAAMHADALAAWGTAARDDLARWTILVGEDERDQATAAYLEAALTERGATVVETLPPGPPDATAQAAAATEADATAVCVTGAAQLPLVAALDAAGGPLITGPLLERPRYAAASVQIAGAWPLLWHPDLFKYGATQLMDRYTGRYDEPMHGLAYANWAAVTFLVEAALNVGGSRPAELASYLVGEGRFDSRKGKPLTFRPWNRQARQILYVAEAGPTGRLGLSADVPDALRGDADAITARLDALGLSATESACALD